MVINIFQPMKERVEAALKFVSNYELNLYAQPLLDVTSPDATCGDMTSLDRPRGRHCVAVVTSPRLRDEDRSLSVAAFLELPLFPLVDNVIDIGKLFIIKMSSFLSCKRLLLLTKVNLSKSLTSFKMVNDLLLGLFK